MSPLSTLSFETREYTNSNLVKLLLDLPSNNLDMMIVTRQRHIHKFSCVEMSGQRLCYGKNTPTLAKCCQNQDFNLPVKIYVILEKNVYRLRPFSLIRVPSLIILQYKSPHKMLCNKDPQLFTLIFLLSPLWFHVIINLLCFQLLILHSCL